MRDPKYFDELAENFGEALALFREERKMTKMDLAHATGLHLNSIQLYESGKGCPSLRNVFRIAHALSITPGELVHTAYQAEVGRFLEERAKFEKKELAANKRAIRSRSGDSSSGKR